MTRQPNSGSAIPLAASDTDKHEALYSVYTAFATREFLVALVVRLFDSCGGLTTYGSLPPKRWPIPQCCHVFASVGTL